MMTMLLGLLGGGGVLGIAALYFLGGAKVLGIVKGVVDFFKTPGGQKVAIAIVVALLAYGLFKTGRNYERNKCDADELREQLQAEQAAHAETKRQIRAGEDINQRDSARAAEGVTEDETNRKNVDATPLNRGPCLDAAAAKRVYDVR